MDALELQDLKTRLLFVTQHGYGLACMDAYAAKLCEMGATMPEGELTPEALLAMTGNLDGEKSAKKSEAKNALKELPPSNPEPEVKTAAAKAPTRPDFKPATEEDLKAPGSELNDAEKALMDAPSAGETKEDEAPESSKGDAPESSKGDDETKAAKPAKKTSASKNK